MHITRTVDESMARWLELRMGYCPQLICPTALYTGILCTCRVSGSIHPGVIQKAERFVAAAQLKLASSLPKEVMGRLRVVVHTHTDVEVGSHSF